MCWNADWMVQVFGCEAGSEATAELEVEAAAGGWLSISWAAARANLLGGQQQLHTNQYSLTVQQLPAGNITRSEQIVIVNIY